MRRFGGWCSNDSLALRVEYVQYDGDSSDYSMGLAIEVAPIDIGSLEVGVYSV